MHCAYRRCPIVDLAKVEVEGLSLMDVPSKMKGQGIFMRRGKGFLVTLHRIPPLIRHPAAPHSISTYTHSLQCFWRDSSSTDLSERVDEHKINKCVRYIF